MENKMNYDLNNIEEKKISWKQILMISSLIFGMFFGAGNLIFPVHLGQMAGENWLSAGAGFIFSGALFPLFALLAVVVTKSEGLYELVRPVGRVFSVIFLFLVQLTIGPLLATPRTAAVAFEIGILPFVSEKNAQLGMLLFSAAFFGLAYFLCSKESDLLKFIGKYLNTIFLVLLFLIFIMAFLNPLGSLNHPATESYQSGAFAKGFLDGYNTLDTLALLAFSVTFIKSVKQLGCTDKNVAKVTAVAGSMSLILEGIIYASLILIGSMSLGKFAVSANGGIALTQIITSYLGPIGVSATGVLVTLGVFTTAMGLLASFGNDFHKIFPKFSYKFWLRVATITSFTIANVGLNNIIRFSLPVLMFLYPLALTITILSLLGKFFNYYHFVYKVTMYTALIPAILDMLDSSGESIKSFPPIAGALQFYHENIPFASVGMGWVVPATIAFVISFVGYHIFKNKNKI